MKQKELTKKMYDDFPFKKTFGLHGWFKNIIAL